MSLATEVARLIIRAEESETEEQPETEDEVETGEECDSCISRMDFTMLAGGVSSLVLSVGLVLWVHHVGTLHTPGGRPYLSSLGIGLSVVAFALMSYGVCYVFGAIIPGWKKEQDDRREAMLDNRLVLHPISSRPLCGLDWCEVAEDVLRVDTSRIVKALLLLGRVCLNISFVSLSFRNLPARDPDERLNEARCYVGWIEILVVGYKFAIGLVHVAYVTVVSLRKRRKTKKTLVGCSTPEAINKRLRVAFRVGVPINSAVRSLKTCATFSVFQLITLASPAQLIQKAQHLFSKTTDYLARFGLIKFAVGSLVVVAAFASWVLFACLGVLALVIKINQVDFVTRQMLTPRCVIENTDWAHVISLLGFVSAIAGVSDADHRVVQAVLDVAAGGSSVLDRDCTTDMAKFIIFGECFARLSIAETWIVVLTLDASDYEQLCFEKKDS